MGQREDDLALFRTLVENDDDLKPPPRPSQVESVVRGASQGASSGWGDELGAGIDTVISKIPGVRSLAQGLRGMQPSAVQGGLPVDDPNITYAQRRDQARTQNQAAQQANPVSYGAGEVAGGLVQMAAPGLGAAGKGASAASALLRGAGQGAASGLGYSDASGFLRPMGDTLKGAGVGAGFGVLRALPGATGRADERIFQDFGRGAGAKAQQKLEQIGAPRVAAADVTFDIRKAADPRAAVSKGSDLVGGEIGNVWKAIDSVGVQASMDDVSKSLAGMEAKLAGRAATAPMAASVAAIREDLAGRYGKSIPLSELNGEIKAIQKQAFAGSQLDPSAAASLKRTTARALDDVLQKGLKEAATLPGAAAAVQRLPQLNKNYQTLKTLGDVVKKSVPKERFAKPEGLIEGAKQLPGKFSSAVDDVAATTARAFPSASTVGAMAGRPSPALSQPITDALVSGDRRKAIDLVGQEVYGE